MKIPPNTKIDFKSLASEVVYRLRKSGKTIRVVSEESGVNFHWLSSLWQNRVTNPCINNMQKLADYLNKIQP